MIDHNKAREILDYNNIVIEDNLVFGYKSRMPETEINEYYKEAMREQRMLKKHMRDGGEVEWGQHTQMWVAKQN